MAPNVERGNKFKKPGEGNLEGKKCASNSYSSHLELLYTARKTNSNADGHWGSETFVIIFSVLSRHFQFCQDSKIQS